MAPLGENFRGNQGNIVCPLCHNHLDNQATIFQCEAIRKEIGSEVKMEDLYKDKIELSTARTITTIEELRVKLLEKLEN